MLVHTRGRDPHWDLQRNLTNYENSEYVLKPFFSRCPSEKNNRQSKRASTRKSRRASTQESARTPQALYVRTNAPKPKPLGKCMPKHDRCCFPGCPNPGIFQRKQRMPKHPGKNMPKHYSKLLRRLIPNLQACSAASLHTPRLPPSTPQCCPPATPHQPQWRQSPEMLHLSV